MPTQPVRFLATVAVLVLSLPLLFFVFRQQPLQECRPSVCVPQSRADARCHGTVGVTCYFPVAGAKHSNKSYAKWISNFFRMIGNASFVIYTAKEYTDSLQPRAENSNIRFVTAYSSPFEFPPIKPFVADYKTWQHDADPEKNIHVPELYAIWNGKEFMVANAIAQSMFPPACSYYWVDIGSWRDDPALPSQGQWPQADRVAALERASAFDQPEPKVILEMVDYSAAYFAGGFFGGSSAALLWFAHAFYTLHSEMILQRKFVGKDQTLIRQLALALPHRFLIIKGYSSNTNPWFYFQPFFLNPVAGSNISGDRELHLLSDLLDESARL